MNDEHHLNCPTQIELKEFAIGDVADTEFELRASKALSCRSFSPEEQKHYDPASPRRDWSRGEVGGVLLITRPLQREIELTQSGLQSAFVLIANVETFLTGLTLVVIWAARTRVRKTEVVFDVES